MFSILNTSRYEYLLKTLLITILIYKKEKLYIYINNHLKFAKLTNILIIYYYNRQ